MFVKVAILFILSTVLGQSSIGAVEVIDFKTRKKSCAYQLTAAPIQSEVDIFTLSAAQQAGFIETDPDSHMVIPTRNVGAYVSAVTIHQLFNSILHSTDLLPTQKSVPLMDINAQRVLLAGVSVFGLREYSTAGLPGNPQPIAALMVDDVSHREFENLKNIATSSARPAVKNDFIQLHELDSTILNFDLVIDVAGLASRRSLGESLQRYSRWLKTGGHVALWLPTAYYAGLTGDGSEPMNEFRQGARAFFASLPGFRLKAYLKTSDYKFLSPNKGFGAGMIGGRFDGVSVILEKTGNADVSGVIKEDILPSGLRVLRSVSFSLLQNDR